MPRMKILKSTPVKLSGSRITKLPKKRSKKRKR
jgi:hypothetical protein